MNLLPSIKICLGSLAMGIWAVWAFEVFTLFASYLGQVDLAAQ
jgi:hypothetical protein